MLALDQDPLVKPAKRVSQLGAPNARTEVWVREPKEGNQAVGLFNRGGNATEATLNGDEATLTGKWIVRDLWQHENLGILDAKLTLQVPAHGAVLLKLSPASNGK